MTQRDEGTAPFTAVHLDGLRDAMAGGQDDAGAHLLISNRCHPRRGLLLAYSEGVMLVLCGKCRTCTGSFEVTAGALPPAHCASCDGHSCPDTW